MTVNEVMQELEKMGTASVQKIWANHGARGDFFGVKVGDMKTIQKKVKKDYELSKALYQTANYDAMYLAGLIADEKKMTKKDLLDWVRKADWYMISEYTVPWIAAESAYGWELGLEWVDDQDENIQSAGWCTLSNMLTMEPDEKIDKKRMEALLKRVEKNIHTSGNRVRYTMNGFVIALGGYVPALKDQAVAAAKKIGEVQVEMGGTACKVPDAVAYIDKMLARGPVKKKKMVRC